MTTLRVLGRKQGRAMESVLASAGVGLLSRLAQSECLLALARLASMRIDLASYAANVVEVVTEFVPCTACRLSLDVSEVPAIDVTYGDLADDDAAWQRRPVVVEGRPVGEVGFATELAEFASGDFLASVSEQVSSSLEVLVEAERLRRRVAVAQALHLAEALTDDASPDDVALLVDALAALPNAIGARLDIVHPAVGGAVHMDAGAVPDGSGETRMVPGGSIAVALQWSSTAQERDRAALGEVLAIMVRSLEKAEERRRLRAEAETDPLTGIGNRRRAIKMLAAAIGFAERTGGSVGVLFLDLDHFKKVNDTYGHDVGDQVLARFASHLARMVRSYDTVARYGGEEFLVVCPGLERPAGIGLARRILDSTPGTCADLLPEGWRQTVSAGLACYPETSDHADGIVRAADQALYAAKVAGRNQVRSAPPVEESWP